MNNILSNDEKKTVTKGQWLSDNHIGFAQSLICHQFKGKINGLQQTLLQYKKPLKQRNMVIQIIHINGNHWALITTIDCPEGTVKIYDPLYNLLSIKIIANLIHF